MISLPAFTPLKLLQCRGKEKTAEDPCPRGHKPPLPSHPKVKPFHGQWSRQAGWPGRQDEGSAFASLKAFQRANEGEGPHPPRKTGTRKRQRHAPRSCRLRYIRINPLRCPRTTLQGCYHALLSKATPPKSQHISFRLFFSLGGVKP